MCYGRWIACWQSRRNWNFFKHTIMIAKIKQWIIARREKKLREWLRQATIKGDLTIEGNLIVKGTVTSIPQQD